MSAVRIDWQALLQLRQRLPQTQPGPWFAQLSGQPAARSPLALALLGGRQAATPGLAFVAGYQAALRALWPQAPAGLGALCASEGRSVRLTDCQTRLVDGQLSGRKDFVTAATALEWLLVSAREESPGESPRLALGLLQWPAAGARIEPLPPLPILCDIDHGRLWLQQTPCQRLPGDGWNDQVKPFRALEDLHVLAALLAWLLAAADEQGWPQPARVQLLGLLAACAGLAGEDVRAPAVQVLLGGVLAQWQAQRGLFEGLLEGPLAALWRRDSAVLELARSAREQRLVKALAHFAPAV